MGAPSHTHLHISRSSPSHLQAAYVAELLRYLRCTDGDLEDFVGELGGPAAPMGQQGLAFSEVRVRKDMYGVDRFVTAVRTEL